MDDALFETWSNKLTELRQERLNEFILPIDRGEPFFPANFYEGAARSLDRILEEWLNLERPSLEKTSGDGFAEAFNTASSELDSIVDLELEALDRDLDAVRERTGWDVGSVQPEKVAFESLVSDMRKKFVIKLNALKNKKKSPELTEQAKPVRTSGGVRSGSGFAMFIMFMLGLILGAAPGVFFWNEAQKGDAMFDQERARLLSEKRALQDSMALLQERYAGLASGKARNLIEIERELDRIRSSIREKKASLERDFVKNKEKLIRKIPAGTKLDQALDKIEREKTRKIEELDAAETVKTQDLVKERDILRELIGR